MWGDAQRRPCHGGCLSPGCTQRLAPARVDVDGISCWGFLLALIRCSVVLYTLYGATLVCAQYPDLKPPQPPVAPVVPSQSP